MSLWSKSYITFGYYDGNLAHEEKCEVLIDKTKIVISWYDDDYGRVIYRGKNNGDGHFYLTSTNPPGNSYLHRFPGSDILSGYNVEEGYDYFWKIDLN